MIQKFWFSISFYECKIWYRSSDLVIISKASVEIVPRETIIHYLKLNYGFQLRDHITKTASKKVLGIRILKQDEQIRYVEWIVSRGTFIEMCETDSKKSSSMINNT